MNRFFYICPDCLFHAAAEAEGHRAPPAGQCPVCSQNMQIQGATRGVLSYQTPCDDRCTMATGRNCTCNCGGRNHGSQIVVPIINKFLDLTHYPQAPLAELRANWQKWHRLTTTLTEQLPADLATALDDYDQGRRITGSLWNDVINFRRATRHARSLKLYRLRFKALEDIRARFCPTSQLITSAAPVAPFHASQLVLSF